MATTPDPVRNYSPVPFFPIERAPNPVRRVEPGMPVQTFFSRRDVRHNQHPIASATPVISGRLSPRPVFSGFIILFLSLY
jgi:hypothetical protein